MRARQIGSMLIVVLFAACSPQNRASTAGPLVIGEMQEPQSLNPLLLEGAMSELVGPAIFSQLLVANPQGELAPDLATQVPSSANGGISRDGLTITYRLRAGVTWQDGVPLTASDVAFTFAQIMNSKNDVPSRSGFDQVATVQTPDAHTVRVILKRRYSGILANFFGPDQNYQILPRHLLAQFGDLNHVPFNGAPVGSGPYRVQAWRRGDELVLTANERYFRGKPGIAQIRLRFITDSNTLVEQLRTGEITAQFDAAPAYLQQYQALRGMTVTRTPITGTELLLFNTADAAVHDVRVRRAIVEGLDLPRLVRDATRGAETPRDAGRGFFSWPYDPSISSPRYDPADARRLLAAAGAKTPLELGVVLESGVPEAQQIALTMQQQLRPLGVNLSIRSYSPVQFAAPATSGGPLFAGTFQIAVLRILSGIDPNTSYFFGCDQLPPKGFNLSRLCDVRIQGALDADAQTYDPAARRRYSVIVQREVADELPIVPLWRRRSISVYRTSLQGVDPSPTSPYWNIGNWHER